VVWDPAKRNNYESENMWEKLEMYKSTYSIVFLSYMLNMLNIRNPLLYFNNIRESGLFVSNILFLSSYEQ